MLKPSHCRTFQDYIEIMFLPFINKQLKGCRRLDLVWDQYPLHSLKDSTRKKRGQGVRRKVTLNGLLPNNWATFLRSTENKIELFALLAEHFTMNFNDTGALLVSTYNSTVISSSKIFCLDNDTLSPCNHEEADTRMFLHVAHASKQFSNILIKTVDTDVVVLAISLFTQLNISRLWIEFGVGKSTRFIPIHEVVDTMAESTSRALPLFHAITGCDTCSSFTGKGKRVHLLHGTFYLVVLCVYKVRPSSRMYKP